MSAPLAYWHCGGETLGAGGRKLGAPDVAALLGEHLEKAAAARAAGAVDVAATARRLALQLVAAAEAAARWRRASAPLPGLRGRAGIIFP